MSYSGMSSSSQGSVYDTNKCGPPSELYQSISIAFESGQLCHALHAVVQYTVFSNSRRDTFERY